MCMDVIEELKIGNDNKNVRMAKTIVCFMDKVSFSEDKYYFYYNIILKK